VKRASTLDVLEEGVVGQIAARGSIRTFPANAIIINEGDRTDSLYVILSGRVKVFAATPSGKAVVFSLHGAGEYIGEFFDGGSRWPLW
jgi:CRP/FNR family cyclic AMP-dependent transcriptional regulator